jgi:3-hydroxymyristoyl/3-hydroxydecanoyl-(acyl carrier protein) dehydratase
VRWRLVDRVTRLEPWREIAGVKTVSLEEYTLLEPLGRSGAMPETLVLEASVQLARWLLLVSSDFQQEPVLAHIASFTFLREAGRGAVLQLTAVLLEPRDGHHLVQCQAEAGEETVAAGAIALSLAALEPARAAPLRHLWGAIHA